MPERISTAERLVSVVLPTFNRRRTLPNAIDSVLAQSHQRIQLIVVDDGSGDGSRELIEDVASRDARVAPVFHATNRGRCAARNTALDIVSGDFVAFIDSDDRWYPWKLTAQMQVFERFPEVGLCWTDMVAVDPTGANVHSRYLRRMYAVYEDHPEESLFSNRDVVTVDTGSGQEEVVVRSGDIHRWMWIGNMVHTPTVVTRTEAIPEGHRFEHVTGVGEDWPFHLGVCRESPAALLDVPTIDYQIGRDDQAIHPKNALGYARSYVRTIGREMSEHGDRIDLDQRTIARTFAQGHEWLGDALLPLDRRAARRELVTSLRHLPRVDRRAILLARSFVPGGLERWLREALRRS